ncbi:hypothetical protein LY76DRAFT_100319 [Colletotrichum caudatum]|nr:hypothetical protein LY76DRAFT_100319 [Colletotrichum caudatum]
MTSTLEKKTCYAQWQGGGGGACRQPENEGARKLTWEPSCALVFALLFSVIRFSRSFYQSRSGNARCWRLMLS